MGISLPLPADCPSLTILMQLNLGTWLPCGVRGTWLPFGGQPHGGRRYVFLWKAGAPQLLGARLLLLLRGPHYDPPHTHSTLPSLLRAEQPGQSEERRAWVLGPPSPPPKGYKASDIEPAGRKKVERQVSQEIEKVEEPNCCQCQATFLHTAGSEIRGSLGFILPRAFGSHSLWLPRRK